MLDDGKEGEAGGLPPAGLGGPVIHFRDVPNRPKGLGTGWVSPAGEDSPSLEWNQGVEGPSEDGV